MKNANGESLAISENEQIVHEVTFVIKLSVSVQKPGGLKRKKRRFIVYWCENIDPLFLDTKTCCGENCEKLIGGDKLDLKSSFQLQWSE